MKLTFLYPNKNKFSHFSRILFDILADNMSIIAPTGNSLEEDYHCWLESLSNNLKKDERQLVLIKNDTDIIGFFQYVITEDTFVMEEIQIKVEFHGKGVFESLYTYLVDKLPTNLKYVEAYANKANVKSIGILEHLGLLKISESKNGFKFKGDYNNLKSNIKDFIDLNRNTRRLNRRVLFVIFN